MIPGNDEIQEHEKLRELCALAMSGTLTANESAQLVAHLGYCKECRAAYCEYRILAKDGMPVLAARYGHVEEPKNWDDTQVRRKLAACLAAEEREGTVEKPGPQIAQIPGDSIQRGSPVSLPVLGTIAACLIAAVGFAGYRAGRRTEMPAKQSVVSAEQRVQKVTTEKKTTDNLPNAQAKRIAQLEVEGAQKQHEMERLRSELQEAEGRAAEIAAAKNNSDGQLHTVSEERDGLAMQLQNLQRAYEGIQTEITSLRAESDQATARSVSLQEQVDQLSIANQDKEQRLQDQRQYLSADRDIRELMGARQLYIADVFDVSSDSRTRKPYGRVFYTKGKSLIFYAFDLDRHPELKNTSTFQAWGKNESEQGKPLNLGILYMDNEANRRWVLRCDDPKQLAEIDAVFVTIEPHGGSYKPTGKPFLYASLRKEVNHP